MEEIRFHGRGGQGTVVAAMLLAKAFFRAGFEVQTFPLFGVERRGAPVEAYLRLDSQKILVRSNIYQPDHLVIMDRKLLKTVDVKAGLKPGGWILVNAPSIAECTPVFDGFRSAVVNAVEIAVHNGLGTRTHPMVNTAVIGAFAGLLEKPSLDDIAEAIREDIDVKTENNVKAAVEGFQRVQVHRGASDG
ncbi:MAG: 2-oxoacid:acceptor oxidoreductase family protein [Desulfobacterales bacterium]